MNRQMQDRTAGNGRSGRGQGRCRGGMGQGNGCRGRQVEHGPETSEPGMGRGQGMGRGRRDGSCRAGAAGDASGVDTGNAQA